MPNKMKYDLEERTAVFGEQIIDFVTTLPRNTVNIELIKQIVRSGTSIGANYVEADGAESKKDFRHKIAICNKESKETKHWLRMIAKAVPKKIRTARLLWQEANELNLIFITIVKNSRNKKGRKIYLDLGKLWALGEVTLNGRSLGIVWKPPYRIEITKAARADQNKLEIEITNTWANRLVGDAQLPPDQRYCRTNITYSGTPGKPWKDIPLRQSGLLGPVELVQAVEKTISLTK